MVFLLILPLAIFALIILLVAGTVVSVEIAERRRARAQTRRLFRPVIIGWKGEYSGRRASTNGRGGDIADQIGALSAAMKPRGAGRADLDQDARRNKDSEISDQLDRKSLCAWVSSPNSLFLTDPQKDSGCGGKSCSQ
jgi:hypothetical protein